MKNEAGSRHTYIGSLELMSNRDMARAGIGQSLSDVIGTHSSVDAFGLHLIPHGTGIRQTGHSVANGHADPGPIGRCGE